MWKGSFILHLFGNALICASTVLECSCCRIPRYVAAPHLCIQERESVPSHADLLQQASPCASGMPTQYTTFRTIKTFAFYNCSLKVTGTKPPSRTRRYGCIEKHKLSIYCHWRPIRYILIIITYASSCSSLKIFTKLYWFMLRKPFAQHIEHWHRSSEGGPLSIGSDALSQYVLVLYNEEYN